MKSGTIDINGFDEPAAVGINMIVTQDSRANVFGTSSWTGGTIGGAGSFQLWMIGA